MALGHLAKVHLIFMNSHIYLALLMVTGTLLVFIAVAVILSEGADQA